MQALRQTIQLELALEPVVKGEARSPGPRGTEARMARVEPESPVAAYLQASSESALWSCP